jgi:hypothetical protein
MGTSAHPFLRPASQLTIKMSVLFKLYHITYRGPEEPINGPDQGTYRDEGSLGYIMHPFQGTEDDLRQAMSKRNVDRYSFALYELDVPPMSTPNLLQSSMVYAGSFKGLLAHVIPSAKRLKLEADITRLQNELAPLQAELEELKKPPYQY